MTIQDHDQAARYSNRNWSSHRIWSSKRMVL